MTTVRFTRLPGVTAFGIALVCVCSLVGHSIAEDRTLSLHNIHTKENATITFKRDGKFIPEGMKQINHFMRDWRKNIEITMDPALIDLIWELHRELGSQQPVHLICGHRSSGTNESLRRTVGGQAKNSRHITGQAADLMFPDVPIKQLRYSALVRERGGVGFYPSSGIPFIHVDTGNVRHWPRISRMELAVIASSGRSRHIPADGRPITKDDHRLMLAKWKAGGNEMPWVLGGSRASARPMLASFTPSDADEKPALATASLGGRPSALVKRQDHAVPLKAQTGTNPSEQQPAEEGEEQDDEMTFEPLPASLIWADNVLAYEDFAEAGSALFEQRKLNLLMASPSVLASDEFGDRLRSAGLDEARQFAGPAITPMQRGKARVVAAASLSSGTESRLTQ